MLQLRKSRIGRFLHDRRGNVAIIFALALIPVIGLVGLGLDGSRALNAAVLAQGAADAAALATARQVMSEKTFDNRELNRIAHDYFYANALGNGTQGATFDNLNVTVNRGAGTLTVTVDTIMPTLIGQLFHVDEITMQRSSTANYEMKEVELELGLMLDVTGSMRRRGKLDSLKLATNDLIEILMPEGRDSGRVRIGLAPYSAAVNTGVYAAAASNETSRDGCVVERSSGDLDGEAPPSRRSYFRAIEQANREIVSDWEDPGYDYYACPDAEVLGLTGDRTLLERTIDSYRANGRTAGHLGIAWAWYLVSPSWASFWPGESRPERYGRENLVKAVVLMTDGEFNASYQGSDHRGAATHESFDRAGNLCDNIKDAGVVVFAVGFDLREQSAIDALKDCASGTGSKKLFFEASNEDELRAAYRDIATRLSPIRIMR